MKKSSEILLGACTPVCPVHLMFPSGISTKMNLAAGSDTVS